METAEVLSVRQFSCAFQEKLELRYCLPSLWCIWNLLPGGNNAAHALAVATVSGYTELQRASIPAAAAGMHRAPEDGLWSYAHMYPAPLAEVCGVLNSLAVCLPPYFY
jgi:hypothetical protein